MCLLMNKLVNHRPPDGMLQVCEETQEAQQALPSLPGSHTRKISTSNTFERDWDTSWWPNTYCLGVRGVSLTWKGVRTAESEKYWKIIEHRNTLATWFFIKVTEVTTMSCITKTLNTKCLFAIWTKKINRDRPPHSYCLLNKAKSKKTKKKTRSGKMYN